MPLCGGLITIEPVRVSHSLVDCVSLAVTTPIGTIIHTGDFKVDETPVCGSAIDLERFREIGDRGVLALFTDSTNAEIAHVWFRLAIANAYTAAYPAMERYMVRIGRRKLIVPLYRDLAATPAGLALAKKIYGTARAGYHPLAQDTLDPVVKFGK